MTRPFDPRSWELNYVVANGITSPGRAWITGAHRPYKWDVQEGYGLSGARTIFRGRGIARPTLTITLWEPEHFLLWPLFTKALEPPKPTLPLVVKLGHPLLAAADIDAVGIEQLGQLEKQSNGTWVSVTNLIEWRPPAPAIVKPRGAIPAADAGKPIPPKTEADKALEEARADVLAKRTGR